ncbi:hypothetical protein EAG_00776 [Camponotus floridanus]|uniref:Uncharacterized protein n=1 Tax=Camponotus floridanus TaxID=104421 RepID=E2B0N4_CAMFO|nr:hypothetical protein EAG_00776 [Camponotus floridanus]
MISRKNGATPRKLAKKTRSVGNIMTFLTYGGSSEWKIFMTKYVQNPLQKNTALFCFYACHKTSNACVPHPATPAPPKSRVTSYPRSTENLTSLRGPGLEPTLLSYSYNLQNDMKGLHHAFATIITFRIESIERCELNFISRVKLQTRVEPYNNRLRFALKAQGESMCPIGTVSNQICADREMSSCPTGMCAIETILTTAV